MKKIILLLLLSVSAIAQRTIKQKNVEKLADSLAKKVDKITGKGLSSNDYTTTEKNKLAEIDTKGSLISPNVWAGSSNTFQNLKLFTYSMFPTSTSESYAFGNFVGSTPSVANAVSYGQISQMTYSGSSVASKMYGIYSILRNNGNASDVFSAVEAQVENAGNGITQSAYGIRTTAIHSGAGTTVDLMGIKINPNTKSAGTVTNNWGIHIASQNISGAANSGLFFYGNGNSGRISWGNNSNTSTLNLYQSMAGSTTLETDGTLSVLSGAIIRASTGYNLRIRNSTKIGGIAALGLHFTNDAGSAWVDGNIESSDLRINAYQGGITRINTGGGAVTIGGNQIDGSAVLNINSTTKGLLVSRMTTAQKNAILSPATGLLVFDTDLNKLNIYLGTWRNNAVE